MQMITLIAGLAVAILASVGFGPAAAAQNAEAAAGRGSGAAQPESFDVVVYGGTAGGVVAAVQAARQGKQVVLIEPGKHLGGLTAGGLGATDIGNKGAIGGISRTFYKRLGEHYKQDEAWKFEPHVAEQLMDHMASEAGVTVVRSERLDLAGGVEKAGARILSIRMESGRRFAGRMFIDATYEGDLMAKAGVSYSVGREANAEYGETLNGVQLGSKTHQFNKPVDPYVEPGNPASGLLPGIHAGGPGKQATGDKRVQAYNFRMCLTDVPANQIPFPKPAGYDPLRYELLLRYMQAGVFDVLGNNAAHAQRQDRHEQQRRFRHRQYRHELRLSRRRLCGPRADLSRSRRIPAGADVVPGQRSARAGDVPKGNPPLGAGQRRIRRQRRLAAAALRARGAADEVGLRDDPAQLPGHAPWPRTPWAWRLTAWTRTTRSAT